MKNTVFKGRDNDVEFLFTFEKDSAFYPNGLNLFNRIEIEVGGESYDSVANPSVVVINSSTTVSLFIGPLTSLIEGSYDATITGYGPSYPNGRVLTSPSNRTLKGRVLVLD